MKRRLIVNVEMTRRSLNKCEAKWHLVRATGDGVARLVLEDSPEYAAAFVIDRYVLPPLEGR